MQDYWQTIVKYTRELGGLLNTDPWILQVFVVVFLTVLISFVARYFINGLYKRLGRTETLWDDALVDAMRKPLSALIYVIGLSFAMQIIFRETGAAIFDESMIDPTRDMLVVVIIAWFLTRFINRGAENYINSRHARGDYYDRTAIDAIAKLLRISVIITAVLVVMQTLGFSISGVLAFGGIGGIAVGFAAKDMLANFFGGMMVYLDRPFSVGDWIRSPDRDIEGTVEEIGWRLTRIRTFDKRPLYVPNYVFNTVTIENPSRMLNRRIREVIGVRYDDAGKIADIVGDIRDMIRNHPDIDTNQTLIVNFDAFASSSLNILVYTFTKTCDWAEYHRVKEDIMLRIIDIIEGHGAECAFPTTTVHVPDGIRMGDTEESGAQEQVDTGSVRKLVARSAPAASGRPTYGGSGDGQDGGE